MGINHRNLARHIRPGSVLEIETPRLATLAVVVSGEGDRIVARPESALPQAGRVRIRVPMVGALVQATAHLSPVEAEAVQLTGFANVRRQERRAYERLDEPVGVRVLNPYGTDAVRRLAALNIGGHGLLLGWPGPPEVALGERLLLSVELDGAELRAEGEVVRVDANRCALRFTAIAEEDQARIVGYVFRRECARSRRHGLAAGEED